MDSDVGDMISEGLKVLITKVPSFVGIAMTDAWSGVEGVRIRCRRL